LEDVASISGVSGNEAPAETRSHDPRRIPDVTLWRPVGPGTQLSRAR
jgi:hypothetical protein